MTMKTPPIDTGRTPHRVIFDALTALRHEGDDLCSLASAFKRIGNTSVAAELYSASLRIEEMHNIIRDAYAHDIGDRARESEQATANMINAVLATTEIIASIKPR